MTPSFPSAQRLLPFFCTTALGLFVPIQAQITPDSTLGSEASTVTPNAAVQGDPADLIEGGAIRGSNLFHSFQEFNIGAGQRVYFANPDGINSILSRITGNAPSNLFGTMGSTNYPMADWC
jgi:large exoprotein involved in heme utilization and adhesion